MFKKIISGGQTGADQAALDAARLNVAGPRASKDPEIYLDVLNVIESVYDLGMIAKNPQTKSA